MSVEKTKPYYPVIDIVKGVTVLLVVMGHSSPRLMQGLPENFGMASFIMSIYSFHMAVFMFVSGFLSSRKLYMDTVSIGTELKKNFQRLLIPYFVYSVLVLVLKQFLGEYAANPFSAADAALVLLGVSPHGGMWFLWSSFVLSAIFLFASRFRRSGALFLGIGALGFAVYIALNHLVRDTLWYSPVRGVLCFALFYALGIVAARHGARIAALCGRIGKPATAFVAVLSAELIAGWTMVTIHYGVPEFIQELSYPLSAALGIVLCFSVASLMQARPQGFIRRLFREWGHYSYDIYLLSYFVIVPVRVVAHNILHVPYAVSVLAIIVFGMALPYLISRFALRKISIFRKILLGSWDR